MQERASSRPTYRRSSDLPESKANAVHAPYKAGNTVRPTHRTNMSVAGSSQLMHTNDRTHDHIMQHARVHWPLMHLRSFNYCPITPRNVNTKMPSCLVFRVDHASFRNGKPQASLETSSLLILMRLTAKRGQATRFATNK
jgi:hypothetical protein